MVREGWTLDLTGYVQADAVALDQASVDQLDPGTSQPLNQERFLIRRGRLRAEARKDALSASLELDGNTVNGPAVRLVSAEVAWRYDRLLVASAGLFKTPFGAEVPASERDKPFLEPPTWARAMFPGSYDAGARIAGGYQLLRWTFAIVNGSPAGDLQWAGKDPSSSFDFVGRIGADIAGPRRWRVEAGVSGLSGTGLHPGTPPTKDSLQGVDENGNGLVEPIELMVIPGKPGTPSEKFHRNALGADLAVHWCLCTLGQGVAFGEVALATNLDRGIAYADPVAQSRDIRELGFAVGIVQEVTPRAMVGVRFDRYDADADANERAGTQLVRVDRVYSTLSLMAAARWSTSRLVVEYDHERNPLGRSDSGEPITRSADRITLRAQVGF